MMFSIDGCRVSPEAPRMRCPEVLPIRFLFLYFRLYDVLKYGSTSIMNEKGEIITTAQIYY